MSEGPKLDPKLLNPGPKMDPECPKMGHKLPNSERSLVVIDIVRLLLANAAGSVLLDTLCTLARRLMGRAAGNLFRHQKKAVRPTLLMPGSSSSS